MKTTRQDAVIVSVMAVPSVAAINQSLKMARFCVAGLGWLFHRLPCASHRDPAAELSGAAVEARYERLDQWHAFYPACRDAGSHSLDSVKGEEYSIDTDYITALGGSAGSLSRTGLYNGRLCKDVSEDDDATLAGTYLN